MVAFQEGRQHEPRKDGRVACERNTGLWAKPLRWVRLGGWRLRLEGKQGSAFLVMDPYSPLCMELLLACF